MAGLVPQVFLSSNLSNIPRGIVVGKSDKNEYAPLSEVDNQIQYVDESTKLLSPPSNAEMRNFFYDYLDQHPKEKNIVEGGTCFIPFINLKLSCYKDIAPVARRALSEKYPKTRTMTDQEVVDIVVSY